MPPPVVEPAIAACVAELEVALRRLATDLVREVLQRELAACRALVSTPRATTPPTATRAIPKRRGRRRRSEPIGAPPEADQHATLPEIDSAPAAAPDAPAMPHPAVEPPVPDASAPTPPMEPSKRDWSRTRVVTELAQWLLEDPTIDAATLGRRGQGALVSWARRLFGRFDAALNAANLHLAELYPDGPPKRGVRAPPIG
jgi:hypothetical protein